MSQPFDTSSAPAAAAVGPLSGLLVVDLSRALAGPHAAQMLGDLGARVIKVENPGRGDDTRGWGPPFVGPDEDIATYFLACNRNKESICLDLKSEDGHRVLTSLLERADVLVENFRPGVLDRLGFPPETLKEVNPKLITLSISGFGHDGPEANRAGYDQILQGEAGLMSLTGPTPEDPQRVGVPIGDLLAGMYGAYGVLAALHERERTGRGQVVRTSLLAAIVGVHAFQGTRATVAGETPQAQGNHHPSIAPYGLFACRGGYVQISVGSPKLWDTFVATFGLQDRIEGLETNAQRVTRRQDVIALVEAAFAEYDSEALLSVLAEAGIPAGRVRNLQEVYAWEQVASQHLVSEVQHPTLGPINLPGPPLRFFTPAGEETTKLEHATPPELDADSATIRAEFGPELAGTAASGTSGAPGVSDSNKGVL
ncbi:MAG: CaiB/BaiF CoA transferase family protein [Galactobacter sp.]|uniref:CaiB/BaiF CoA transferase family protein n=1 Tax=Galactobacter sp. TaxID=2676125 RepID=UPI0025B895D6|nr:CoA transferase [Galactobacter sp.]